MQMSEIRAAVTAQPFAPFEMIMCDGDRVWIEHPECVAIPPFENVDDRRMVIFERHRTRIVDAFHVLRLEMAAEATQ